MSRIRRPLALSSLLLVTALALPGGSNLEAEAHPSQAEEFDPASWLRSGPLLGPVEVSQARVWLQTRFPAKVQLRYWEKGKPETARLSTEIDTSEGGDHIAVFTLTALAFGTRYEYEVYLQGRRLARPHALEFQTQALWRWRTDPPPVRVAFGSCAYINDPPYDRPGKPYGGDYPIFGSIARQSPDAMIWLGDDVYYREADTTTEAGMRRRWAKDRSLPELQELLAATAHFAMWDDHDFGANDADWSFRDREKALEIFRDYWLNPSYGTREAPGVYTRFELSDVEFFLLDGRSYRSPDHARPGPLKRMYGAEQLGWLEDALTGSQATFKVVAGGSQFFNPYTFEEGMASYPEEQKELLAFLSEARIPGVVFLSGDRHFTEVLKRQLPGGYPLYEYTSSPLTSGTFDPKKEMENPARVPGTLVLGRRNFGLLEVRGKAGERVLTLKAMGVEGDEIWKLEIPEKDLRPPGAAGKEGS